jgi:four helix bundle protein
MAEPLKSYRELRVWQGAFDLALVVYEQTRLLPNEERFGLMQQMRRAAVSMVSNIAEGYGRGHRKEYLQFLAMANGSLMELETQVLLCDSLHFDCDGGLLLEKAQAVGRQLTALRQSLVPKPRNDAL